MIERRKFKRLDVSKIEVSWKKESNPSSVAYTKNISAGGICLMSNAADSLKEGDFLSLEFKLPTGKKVLVKGRVVWSEDYEIVGQENKSKEAGVEFVDISDEAKEHISKFIFSAIPQHKTAP